MKSIVVGFALYVISPAQAEDEVYKLKLMDKGVHEIIHGYRPNTLKMQAQAPAELKKAPEGLTKPSYGVITVGPQEKPNKILVIIDTVNDKPTKLYVDANLNGDLTDDVVNTFTEKKYVSPTDETKVSYSYVVDAGIPVPTTDGNKIVQISIYQSLAMNLMNHTQEPYVGYYSDYGYTGDVKMNGKTMRCIVEDAGVTGNLSLKQGVMSAPIVWLDINANGKADRDEVFASTKPFQIDGKWWAISDLTPDCTFKIIPSEAPVVAKHVGPDLSPGHLAPAFTAKDTAGNEIKFPETYKGKIVLIDFWATWCGPCVGEIPNVVAAYKKYHEQGLEILGISLDKEDMAEKLAAFTAKKEMPWAQIYEGKFWECTISRKYGIDAIPHMILIDGDTGKILADQSIRGEALAPAIEKALTDKKK